MSTCSKLSNLIKTLIYKIFPVINLILTNCKINQNISKLENINYKITNAETNDIFEDLKEINKKELKRKETIENKGKSILLIITLSGTLLIGTINILYHNCHINLLFIILITGIIYLIISVLTILPIVKTIRFNDLYMEDMYNITECHDNSNIISITFDNNDDEKINEMIKNIKINQLYLLKQSNRLISTISTIKISFILILIFFILTTIDVFLPGVLLLPKIF